MDLQLTGRRALITGSSRGIGLATARALAAEGAHVALLARNRQALEEAAAGLRVEGGPSVVTAVADTADDEQVREAVASVIGELGGVDILVNNAATPGSDMSLADEALPDAINVKVRGYLRCIRAVEPSMVEQGWGRIINVAGLAARQTGTITGTIRNVAVAAMSRNLAEELGPKGINVTVLHPGSTLTEASAGRYQRQAEASGAEVEALEAEAAARVAIGRVVTAAEVADVIAFLASPRSVALNGDPVVASGGTRGSIHY